MIERGILFSAPMVRAILSGAKTQTRRILRFHNGVGGVPIVPCRDGRHSVYLDFDGVPGLAWRPSGGEPTKSWPQWRMGEVCPYGGPLDTLWVREAWRRDGDKIKFRAEVDPSTDGHKWKPGIHLRRVDARITLEITEVRVQRLNDISEADAEAEGLTRWQEKPGAPVHFGLQLPDVWETDPRRTFRRLWDDINGERAPWESNPWTWAISFRRVQQ